MSELIATATSQRIKISIYDQSPPDPAPSVITTKIINYREIKGINRNSFYEALYPFEINLSILDAGNNLFYYLKNSQINRFTCVVEDENDDIIMRGFLLPDQKSVRFYRANNILPLIIFDGVSFMQSAMSYSGYHNLDQLLISILQDNLGYDATLRSITTLKEASSTYSDYYLSRIQVDPEVIVREIDNPTNYDLLTTLLEAFHLELFQEEGIWYLIDKVTLDSVDPNVYEYTDTTQSVASVDLVKELPVLIGDPDVGEEIEKPLSLITRYVELFDIPYETLNQDFRFWESGKLTDWNVEGDITQVGSQTLRFDNKDPKVAQELKRSIRQNNRINIDLGGTYYLNEGLEDDQWEFSIAYCRLFNPFTSEERYLNLRNGTWQTFFVGYNEFLEIDIGEVYDIEQVFSSTIESDPAPIDGFIELVMELNGDHAPIRAANPIDYDIFESTPSSEITFNTPYHRAFASNNENVISNQDFKKVTVTDYSLLNYENGVLYQTGVDQFEKAQLWGADSIPLLQYVANQLATYSMNTASFVILKTSFNANPKKYQRFPVEINGEIVTIYPLQITRQLKPEPISIINGLVLSKSTNFSSDTSFLITEPIE